MLSIDNGLASAIMLGFPSLRDEASACLSRLERVGSRLDTAQEGDSDHVYFGRPWLSDKVAITNMVLRDHNWKVVDFGDSIPIVGADPICDFYGKSLVERNKCLLIHLATSECCDFKDSDEAFSLNLPRILALARDFRLSQYKQALDCQVELGGPTSNDPLIVAQLRSHIRDILIPNHDRGHMSLLCFPVSTIRVANICLIRVTPSGLHSIHIANATEPSNRWVFLVSFQCTCD